MASIMDVPSRPPRVHGRRPGLACYGAPIAGLTFGGVLAALVLANTDLEPFTMRLALALEYCTPGLLSLLALRKRDALYLAAGAVGMLVPFTAMSGVALPLLLPAAMSLVAYGRSAGGSRPRVAGPIVAALAVLLVLSSWVALVARADPYCTTGPNVSECGNDRVTGIEGGLSIAFAVAALVVPATFARSRDD